MQLAVNEPICAVKVNTPAASAQSQSDARFMASAKKAASEMLTKINSAMDGLQTPWPRSVPSRNALEGGYCHRRERRRATFSALYGPIAPSTQALSAVNAAGGCLAQSPVSSSILRFCGLAN
jgi:hypothetical protein